MRDARSVQEQFGGYTVTIQKSSQMMFQTRLMPDLIERPCDRLPLGAISRYPARAQLVDA